MISLRTLGIATAGAIILSAGYAVAVKDDGVRIELNDNDEKSMRHIVIGDRGEFSLRNENQSLDANWRGEFELSDDGNSLAAIDHRFEIENNIGDKNERVVFKDDHGDIKATYYLDDEKQPQSPETDQAVADLMLQLLRASGVKSEERVGIILKNSGVEGVLTEISLLTSDHSIARYSVALTEQVDLSPAQLTQLTTILAKIEGDHDLRTSLRAILEHEKITEENIPAIMSAARNIEGDHDLRLLVEAFAELPLNDETMELVIDLYGRIEGDHDLRVGALAILENPAITTQQTARLLQTAANEIDGDHDMRLILTETAPLFSKHQSLTDAWLDGFAVIESSHDQRLSLTAAAEEGTHSTQDWLLLIEASKDIESSHDKRLTLQSIASEADDLSALQDAYENVAATIDSDHDQRLALEAFTENN